MKMTSLGEINKEARLTAGFLPMKICFKCGIKKHLEDFHAHSNMKDGHLNKCKVCTRADAMKHRTANIEQIREYDRNRPNKENRNQINLVNQDLYRLNFPNRYKAKNKVQYALRKGTLVKQPCFICGAKAEAHHPDYDSPLDVVWLCPPHHKQTHALVK